MSCPTVLVGSTGFIGSNLTRQFTFDELYNSTNIRDLKGKKCSLLVLSGVTAVKWWANQNPDEDRARIDALLEVLDSVDADRVIVVSTVDVYAQTIGVDEGFDCNAYALQPYGKNRLFFEDRVRRRFADATVVRISGVFGPGLKKNIIYDLIHDNCLDGINPESEFQYYNVTGLWRDLQRLRARNIRLANLVTEPLSTRTIIDHWFPGKQVGSKAGPAVRYDIRTCHGGYLADAQAVLTELGDFVNLHRQETAA